MVQDTDKPLARIRARYEGLLVPQLLEIQKQKTASEKPTEWARTLQCLQMDGTLKRQCGPYGENMPAEVLRRIEIDALSNREFVAVSYPWHPSSGENVDFGGYDVESLNRQEIVTSKVRNGVWKRVIAYAQSCGVDPIWIDRECIPQEENSPQKEVAMNSMDIVYIRSKYPLGLLFKPIMSLVDLYILISLLEGEFVQSHDQKLTPKADLNTASKVIMLLAYITSDQWWERAWIFQEDYLSGIRMCLLIPHNISDIGQRAREYFGNIGGELKVYSANFRAQTTLFCLAYLETYGKSCHDGQSACEEILKRACSYKIKFRHPGSGKGKAMSSIIFADIGRRKITNGEDIIPIAANSCRYSVRLAHKRLLATGHSLSLCILALYLLNGEIVKNDERDETLSSRDIFGYLEAQSLDNFNPPVGDGELTFIRNHRFVNVRLSHDGIVTTGLLWTLYKVIETKSFTTIGDFGDERSPGLTKCERARLQQLVSELEKQKSTYLSLLINLEKYLKADESTRPYRTYMDSMAKGIAKAIEQRKTLKLGCLTGRKNSYQGIFISNSDQKSQKELSYVFTAWKPRKEPDDMSWSSNLDNYVSLNVDVIGDTIQNPPRLRIKEWINGLCFFFGTTQYDVVFPWHTSLIGGSEELSRVLN
jgi:hypothetical protein